MARQEQAPFVPPERPGHREGLGPPLLVSPSDQRTTLEKTFRFEVPKEGDKE